LGPVPGKLSDVLCGPLFARGYDRFNKVAEDAGMRDKRRALLSRAQGRTLEIGAGTGVNLEFYPDAVTELVLTEPDAHMRRQLEHKLAAVGRQVEVVEAGGDQLPFPEASFDTAVATLVFCTIADPSAALSERPDARRAPAVPRARALGGPEGRALAGPLGGSLELVRTRLPPQPGHAGDNRARWARGGRGGARPHPEGAADRAASDRG